MERPLEIAFHNLTPSASLDAEIRKHADKLARIYDRLTGCRVSVEALHSKHQTGNVYEVHVAMAVPGRELAVSREPHKAKLKYARPDIRTSIRDAFRAAERQLKDFKAQIRGDVKSHEGEFVQGHVSELRPDADHGFIQTNTGALLYFHRNSLMDGGFDRLILGQAVFYIETTGDTGPMASKVWQAQGPP